MSKRRSGLSMIAGSVDDVLAQNRARREEAEAAPRADTAEEPQRPKGGVTGVGALIAEESSGLRAQLEALQRQLALAGAKQIETALIKPSRFYNRFELDLNPETDSDFKDLVASVRQGGGNSIPALLNRLPGDDEKYELVYGHRRWAACRAAALPLLAYVYEGLEPKIIARLQLIENSDRKDPSVLDRAQQIASQMDSKAWESQAALSREMGVSEGTVSRFLEIAAHIPKSLQMAHPNHHKITVRQAIGLAKLGKTSPSTLKQRIEAVRSRRASLSAEEATNLLLLGEKTADGQAKVKLQWTASANGLTLKVRGLPTAKNLELSKKIEALLSEYGLEGGS